MSFYKLKLKSYITGLPGDTYEQQLRYAEKYLNELMDEHEEEMKQEEEQKKLQTEIQEIYDKLITDFKENPYSDKYETISHSGIETKFHYYFENGDKLIISDSGVLEFNNKICAIKYDLGLTWKYKFISLANVIGKSGRNRIDKEWKYNNRYSEYEFDYEQWKKTYGSYKNSENKTSNKSSHPKWHIYQTLIITISSRKEQLSKMSKTDADRNSLENELNVVIKKMENIKTKYGF